MNAKNKIKTAFTRMEKTLSRRPSMGQGTYHSICSIDDNLSCKVREGDWTIKSGMPVEAGGNGKDPTPGVLGRAALGSCIAIGLKLWAAKLDIQINSLEVEIEADSDDGGLFGTAEVVAGYSAIRYQLRIESNADEEDILNLVRDCEAHSPWLDNFKRAVSCEGQIDIVRAA